MNDAQGDMGQLGLGDDEAELLVPTMVKAPGGMKALQVFCLPPDSCSHVSCLEPSQMEFFRHFSRRLSRHDAKKTKF
jgi:hypothetical protein